MLYSTLIYVPKDRVDAMSTEEIDAHIAKSLARARAAIKRAEHIGLDRQLNERLIDPGDELQDAARVGGPSATATSVALLVRT